MGKEGVLDFLWNTRIVCSETLSTRGEEGRGGSETEGEEGELGPP